jgi:molybdopterin molybdotransferase
MKTFDDALIYLLSKAIPTTQIEKIVIESALGRVLAEDIVSQQNVPPHENSMMDGYAVRAEEVQVDKTFCISQRIAAGDIGQALKQGTVARIFTGAAMPEGANAVIMQEEATEAEGGVQFSVDAVLQYQNVRHIGEDIATGAVILAKGQRLRAQDLGLIASIGIRDISAYKPLRIATFSTGSELLEPGEAPEQGKIYNANRYMLAGLVPQLGLELLDLGRVPDNLEATVDALRQAASVADIVITTGGVSVGDEDYIKPAVEQVGRLDLWKVKMKPGKPLAYGDVMGKPFIGLPGNPVSAFTTFHLFAKPYLLTMQGQTNVLPTPVWLKAGFDWPKSGFRREFVRVRLESKGQHTQVMLFPNQGSGILTSAVWADGLAVIPEDSTVSLGDLVAYYAF